MLTAGISADSSIVQESQSLEPCSPHPMPMFLHLFAQLVRRLHLQPTCTGALLSQSFHLAETLLRVWLVPGGEKCEEDTVIYSEEVGECLSEEHGGPKAGKSLACTCGGSNRKGRVARRVGRAGRSQAGSRSSSLTPSAMEDAPGPSAEKAFGLSYSFAVLLWLLCGIDRRQHTESKQKCWNIAVIH